MWRLPSGSTSPRHAASWGCLTRVMRVLKNQSPDLEKASALLLAMSILDLSQNCFKLKPEAHAVETQLQINRKIAAIIERHFPAEPHGLVGLTRRHPVLPTVLNEVRCPKPKLEPSSLLL